MIRRITITIFSLLFFVLSFSAVFAGTTNSQPSPPTFTSTAPTADHPFGTLFTYNFSATDQNSDPISFKVLGNEQLDANYDDGYYYATGYSTLRWQSFTPLSSGLLTKAGIQLSFKENKNVNVRIYQGEGIGGTVLYTTSIDVYNVNQFWEINIPEASNVIAQAGQVYTIAYESVDTIVNAYMIQNYETNPYAGGRADWYSGQADFQFKVHVKPFTSIPIVSWLSLTDNNNGTGTLSGTPTSGDVGNFSVDLYAHSGTDYVKQTISFAIFDPTPTPPTGVYAVAGNEQITLKWRRNNSLGAAKYYIYGGSESLPTTLIDSTLSAADTTITFNGLTNGTQYFYRIKTVGDTYLISDYSVQDAAVPINGFGNAIELDGYSQFVYIPDITELTGKSFTLEAWAKRGTISRDDFIFGQGVTASDYALHFGFRSNGVFTAGFYSDDLDTNEPYNQLVWIHWAVTYDAETNTKSIYKDGVLIASGPSGNDFLGNGTFYIGSTPWLDGKFYGKIDEARIWNYVRSGSDISNNYLTQMSGEEAGLIALYHFDESSENVVYDATKNGRNGTIENSSGNNFVISTIDAPTTPAEFDANLISNEIHLSWNANTEGKFDHFAIYRNTQDNFETATEISDTVTSLEYTDNSFPDGDVNLFYWIKAVDNNSLESDLASTTISVIDKVLRLVTFDGQFPPLGWSISNPDDDYTWDLYDGYGGEESVSSLIIDQGNTAFLEFYNYSNEGQTDTLKTKPFYVNENDYLKFEFFYRGYDNTYNDGLQVLVSNDGGNTFTDLVFNKNTYTGLRTMPGYYDDDSYPLKSENWFSEGIDLSEYANQEIVVAFVSINGYGNNLYLDNIESSSVPPRPARLYAKGIDSGVELYWTPVSDNNFKQYNIYYGTGFENMEKVGHTASGDASDTTFTVIQIDNGSEYYFMVDAENMDNETGNSSPVRRAIPVTGFGNALALDGVDDFANMYADLAIDYSSFTLEALVKRYPNNNNQYIFGIGNTENVNKSLHVGFNDQNYFLNNFYNNDLASESTYSDTLWHHWAVTFNMITGSRNTYFDGNLIANTTSPQAFANISDFLVGAAFGGIQTLNGDIDEVRVWDYARSESEIYDNRKIQMIGNEPGLMGLWHFDENLEVGNALDAGSGYFHGDLINGAGYISSAELDQAALPVELTAFTAQLNNGKITLNWKTATESNNSGWEIEVRNQETGDRSQNTGWKKTGFVAGKGTTSEKQNYVFSVSVLQSSASILEFRLKQIDADGQFSYSNILTVNLIPETFSLSQNYPNPFNPSTSISYQLASNGLVTLKVFDLLGREVKSLVNQEKPAGTYSVDFSAADLPSGVYFYKLTAGSFTSTKKMMLVK